ncbi:MAG: protein kinase [Planctomycetaceae bacterium]|nr:protein kinase [Planctomycetaceae bacterium]
MDIICPKCKQPVEMLNNVSISSVAGPEGQTVKAEGINCSNCGWVPYHFLDDEGDDFELASDMPVVAHFRLVKPLGKGGFGTVWLAIDINLNRQVALKMPKASGHSISMLLNEAQSAAKLRHPNIVSVYETGKSKEGQAFIASEYIEGLNLSDVLTAGQPTSETMISILITVSEAIHHAHELGIIHRDIKPANIMIDNRGVPYIADFGLAKQISADESISSEGQILGTVNYMAPEQASGQTKLTDHRADIYAVGVILFEMLTGYLPFRGNVRAVLHQKTSQDPPSPRSLNQAIPKDIDTICRKCIEREPGKRYSSALELNQELIRFQNGEPIQARPISTIETIYRWAKRYPVVAGLSSGFVISLALGLIGVTYFWQNALFNAELARSGLFRSQMNLAAQQFSQGDINSLQKTINRIGEDKELSKFKDFSWYYYDNLLEAFAVTVSHGDLIQSVAISNDGQFLCTVGNEGEAALWNAQTGDPLDRIKLPAGRYTAADFSPVRQRLALGETTGYFSIWNPAKLDVPFSRIEHGPPLKKVRYSRDGNYLLTFGDRGAVRIWDLRTENMVWEIPSGQLGANDADMSPDSQYVVIGGAQGVLRIWDITGRRKVLDIVNSSDEREQVNRPINLSDERGESIGSLEYSSDGKRIAVGGEKGNVRIYSSDQGSLLTDHYTYQGRLGSATFLKRDLVLACTGSEQSLKLFDLETRQLIGTYPTHRLSSGVVSKSENNLLLAIGSGDGTAKVLQLNQILQPQMYWHDSPVRSLVFSRDCSSVYSLGKKGEIRKHNIYNHESTVVVPPTEDDYRQIDLIRDETKIFRVGPMPLVNISAVKKDGSTNQSLEKLIPCKSLAGFFLLHESNQLLVLSRTGDLLLYDLDDLDKPISELSLKQSSVTAFALSDREDKIAVAFDNGAIVIVLIESLSEDHQFQLQNSEASVIAFCGAHLIVGSTSGSITTYQLDSSALTPRILEGHGAKITAINSFPDQTKFVTGSRDQLLKIWDLKSGETITTLHGHTRQIFSIAVSPDGRTIASGGLEGDIRIWKSR